MDQFLLMTNDQKTSWAYNRSIADTGCYYEKYLRFWLYAQNAGHITLVFMLLVLLFIIVAITGVSNKFLSVCYFFFFCDIATLLLSVLHHRY